MDILPMRRGDLLVAIGSRRWTKHFKLVMKHAQEQGLKVILIADHVRGSGTPHRSGVVGVGSIAWLAYLELT